MADVAYRLIFPQLHLIQVQEALVRIKGEIIPNKLSQELIVLKPEELHRFENWYASNQFLSIDIVFFIKLDFLESLNFNGSNYFFLLLHSTQ